MTRSRDLADTQRNLGGSVPPFTAGKNKIINGDFNINQRAFITTTTDAAYTFDRWNTSAQDGTSTFSAQTFTPGSAPVTGYESANFLRVVTTGQTLASASTQIRQSIEDVRTFANQTVTISFWAKAASGTPKIAMELDQQFGTGGSTRVTTYIGQVVLSTSWVRYSATVTLPSISGKTIGTNSYLRTNLWMSAGTDFNSRTGSLGIQTNTFDLWGIQLEAGSVATPFTTATGTLAGELAACQRYYFRSGGALGTEGQPAICATQSSTSAYCFMPLPVQMRVAPTSIDYAAVRLVNFGVAAYSITSLTIDTGTTSRNVLGFTADGASGMTANRPVFIYGSTGTATYIGCSAEL